MTKRKVMSIFGMLIMIALIVVTFLPFVSRGSESLSMFEYFEDSLGGRLWISIIIIVELAFGLLAFLMQLCGLIQHSKFAYFTLGFYITNLLSETILLIDNDYFSYVEYGYWIAVGLSVVAFILVFVSGFLKNEKGAKKEKRVPIRYDTKTGKPIYEE